MSDLIKRMIDDAVTSNEKLVPVTVRVNPKIKALVDEVCINYGLSQQEVLANFIEVGAVALNKTLDDQDNGKTTSENTDASFFILNTNKRYYSFTTEMMLNEGIAAAFYGDWKKQINRIKENDWVFLYENTKGIIAFGQSDGVTNKRDFDGDTDECYYQHLKKFTVLKTPIPAADIWKIMGYKFLFLRTLISLESADSLLEAVQKQ